MLQKYAILSVIALTIFSQAELGFASVGRVQKVSSTSSSSVKSVLSARKKLVKRPTRTLRAASSSKSVSSRVSSRSSSSLSASSSISKQSVSSDISVVTEKNSPIIKNAGEANGILHPFNDVRIAAFTYTVYKANSTDTYSSSKLLGFPHGYWYVAGKTISINNVRMRVIGNSDKANCVVESGLIGCDPPEGFLPGSPSSFTVELIADVSKKGAASETLTVFAQKTDLTDEQRKMLNASAAQNPAADPQQSASFIPSTVWTVQQ